MSDQNLEDKKGLKEMKSKPKLPLRNPGHPLVSIEEANGVCRHCGARNTIYGSCSKSCGLRRPYDESDVRAVPNGA